MQGRAQDTRRPCRGVPRTGGGHARACPGLFIGSQDQRPTAGLTASVRFFEEGQQPPLQQLGGLGSAQWAPQRGSGRAPTVQRFSTIFSTQDDLSWHYNIVNYGLSCSRWEQHPVPPPAYAPSSRISRTQARSNQWTVKQADGE